MASSAAAACTLALLLLASLAAAPFSASASHPPTCRQQTKQLCGPSPSSFTFYLMNTVYDTTVQNKVFNSVYGPQPNLSFTNPFAFGVTSTFEDPIYTGATNASQQIGIARGIWQNTGFTEYVLLFMFTANISAGSYTGTLDLFGTLREVDPIRYLSVIGGTGDFLGARGSVSNQLVSIDRTPPGSFVLSFVCDLYY